MIPLLYLDKLLDAIQLKFRDRFLADLKNKAFFSNLYQSFGSEFEKTMELVKDQKAKEENDKKMRTFEESSKAQKTIASMVINPTNNNSKKAKAVKPSAAPAAPEPIQDPDYGKTEAELDEERRQKNLEKFISKNTKKGGKVKSPKPEKAAKKGKAATTWDNVRFGGPAATSQQIKEFEYSDPTPANGNEYSASEDYLRAQYIPDESVVGNRPGSSFSFSLMMYGL